jgi:hypothetical protein
MVRASRRGYFTGGRRSLLGWALHHLVISVACTFSFSGPSIKCTGHSRSIRSHAKRNAPSFVVHDRGLGPDSIGDQNSVLSNSCLN